MKQTLTIILLLLSTILYSQEAKKVIIQTEEGRIGRYFEANQIMYNLYCFLPQSVNNPEICQYTLYLAEGEYGYLNSFNNKAASFRVTEDSVFITIKDKDLVFNIIKE